MIQNLTKGVRTWSNSLGSKNFMNSLVIDMLTAGKPASSSGFANNFMFIQSLFLIPGITAETPVRCSKKPFLILNAFMVLKGPIPKPDHQLLTETPDIAEVLYNYF